MTRSNNRTRSIVMCRRTHVQGRYGRTVGLVVTEVNRYPVKSFGGEALSSAVVEPWGLRGDHRWMLVDGAGDVITAREVHRMLLVHATDTDAGISLAMAGAPELEVPVPPDGPRAAVQVWESPVTALWAGPEADQWLHAALGLRARLVYLADPTQRPTNPLFSTPQDRVSLADGYPLLLTTEDSLAALNDHIAAGPLTEQGPLPMRRFRPSVVVSGAPAWAEDDWRRLRIGSVEFRAVKGCDRCVITTIDPETAIAGKEPIATLARHRRFDGKTWFGMNLVPDLVADVEAKISIGDPVEILESVEPGGGPPR